MQLLDCSFPTVAENLAVDQILLERAERGDSQPDVLRLWESPVVGVVLGRASRAEEEVNLEACAQRGIPVVRRPSGGTAVVLAPGCLVYTLVMAYGDRFVLREAGETHRFVLGRIASALSRFAPGIALHGTSDLAIAEKSNEPPRKFSGNSLRCRPRHFLYHGTLLYQFDASLLDILLRRPPRQPTYRRERPHSQFVTNLPLPRSKLIEAMLAAFPVQSSAVAPTSEQVAPLLAARYESDDWNLAR